MPRISWNGFNRNLSLSPVKWTLDEQIISKHNWYASTELKQNFAELYNKQPTSSFLYKHKQIEMKSQQEKILWEGRDLDKELSILFSTYINFYISMFNSTCISKI